MPKSDIKISIHPSIKVALGYEPSEPDDAVVEDWHARTTRVCKPCWELKYCPYGPLVEQSPILPPPRDSVAEQIQYFKRCLETQTVGSVTILTPEDRQQYKEWISDDQILLKQARFELANRRRLAEASSLPTDREKIDAWIGGKLPPIHVYRVPFDDSDTPVIEDDFSAADWIGIIQLAESLKEKYLHALKIGEDDYRSPLEPARAAWFRERIEKFNHSEYPDNIPEFFFEASCNVFGHMCPVFFAAEASTETSAERRRGRYIPFATKMRVVRRDNYTCQHCGKHLRDDEVEFDHIIPISKGGSSEEHNIRLTCFDCNREKSDHYIP
jgi:hypothetical protein